MTSASRPTRAHLVVLVLALLVTLPSLRLGFVTDDHGFRALLHAPAPYGRPAYDLFRFASGQPREVQRAIRTGHLPWWSAPDLRIHFIRPLTGLLFAADDAVAGSHPLVAHLHSVAWYLALVLAVSRFYRRRLPDGPTAFLASLVFAWSHAHVLPYAWLSARHVLVGGLPAVIAVAAHVRWRSEGWTPGRWLAPIALAVGLAGSEAALAGAVFWLAFDVLGDRARPGRERLGASLPAVIVVLGYVALYRLVGGGAHASGGYHDPVGEPVAFLRVAITRVPILLGDALIGVPAELANVASPRVLALVGLAGIALVTLTYVACRRLLSTRERDALRWLVPGALVSTLLGASGFPSGRVLLLPDLGFAALIGVLLTRGFQAGDRRVLRGALVAVLAGVHLVLAPLSSWRAMARFGHRGRACDAVSEDLARWIPPNGRVFLVASDPLVFLYPRGILADTHPGLLRCASVLSAARSDHRITRVDDHTLALEPLDRTLLDRSFDTLFRGDGRPFAVGDTVRQCDASVRVTDVHEGRPARIEVRFDARLDDPNLVVLTWRDGSLQRLAPPDVNGWTVVPWSPGP